MLCPICGKSVDSISQVVSLCASCQESRPRKESNEGSSAVEEEISLIRKSFIDIEIDPAGFWLRVFATIIDGAVMYVFFIFISLGLMALVGGLLLMSPIIGMLYPLIAGFLAIMLTLFFVAFILPAVLEASKMQGTIGKYLIGLRVINEDGSRIGILKALFRSFIRFLSSVFLCIGFIPAGLTEKKQAVHDIICSTLVIKYKKVSPERIFAYVVLSFIITGIGSYFSRDKDEKDNKNWKSNPNSANELNTSIEQFKESIKKLENSNNGTAIPKIELKTTAPLNVAPSPVSSPELIPPTIKTNKPPTPKAELDESKLTEFERRMLNNKRTKESAGLK